MLFRDSLQLRVKKKNGITAFDHSVLELDNMSILLNVVHTFS